MENSIDYHWFWHKFIKLKKKTSILPKYNIFKFDLEQCGRTDSNCFSEMSKQNLLLEIHKFNERKNVDDSLHWEVADKKGNKIES